MEHPDKLGKVRNDKGTKFIKRILKKKGIVIQGKFRRENDCEIRITNVRKYQHIYYNVLNVLTGSDIRFVYEVDITVKLIGNEYMLFSDFYIRKKIRGYVNVTNIKNELVYFNIKDITISKITLEK